MLLNKVLDGFEGDGELVLDGIFGQAEPGGYFFAAEALLAAEVEYFFPLRRKMVSGLVDEVLQFFEAEGFGVVVDW
jgi:hypothetical protein